MNGLVPGRACGSCTVCCSILYIATLDKPAGVACVHCASGCAIHPTRPQACRDFYCGWRMLEIFSDAWRPDLSGVFAQLEVDDLPPDFAQQTGISLMLVGDHPARTLRQAWFTDFVRTAIAEDIPLFLALPGPAGHHAAKLLLNSGALRDAAASPHRDRLKSELEKALKQLQGYGFRRQDS
jgi:hypothetical protein